MGERETYYRHDGYEYVLCYSYPVISHTPKGVWIRVGWKKKKFILNDARKRWAYPTKELALESFRIRKLRQIEHCRQMEERATTALSDAGFDAQAELKNFFEPRGDLL